MFPQGPKESWLLDWQKQFSGKTFSLAVGILTTGHRQISHTGLSCQISGFVSAFKRVSFEPSIRFWISGNHWKREKSGVELAHKQPSHAVYSKGKMFLSKPNICLCNQRRILHGSARRAKLGRDLTGCRWTSVEELQSEPVAAEHVVSKRSNHCTSLACCTGTSVKAGEARVCFHFQMCSAWVFSALGWESFLKKSSCAFSAQDDLFHIHGPAVHAFMSGATNCLTGHTICKTVVRWRAGSFCNYQRFLPGKFR